MLLVALGGSLGAVCRWGLSSWIDRLRGDGFLFPLGIFAANTAGCFLFGILIGLSEGKGWLNEPCRLLLCTGFLGSFTTFSTFSWDTVELWRGGAAGWAVANVVAGVAAGLLAVWAGYSLGKGLFTGA